MRYKTLTLLTAAVALFGCSGDDPKVPNLSAAESGSAALFFTYPLDDQKNVAPNAPVVFSFASALETEPALGQTGNLGLVPIDTATGPNIMRVRYETDPQTGAQAGPVGYILPGDDPAAGDPPKFAIKLNLLFDAPALNLPLGLEHNVKSLPIDDLLLVGTLDFLPDGRLFIGLENQEPKDVDLEITLAGVEGGQVKLHIPPNSINLSFQSPSIKQATGTN